MSTGQWSYGSEYCGYKAYDLIFANILKGPLIELAPGITESLCTGGYVILSGILNEQADDVIAVYADNGFKLADRLEIAEWTTLTLKRA